MRLPARLRLLAALGAAACASDPTGGGEILVVAQIDVQPPGATIVIGATQQLTATPKTSSGITVPNRTPSWSSEDQGIATVTPLGLVTGVAAGSTVITAQVDDVTRDVTIHVTRKPVVSVTVEPSQATIQVGGAQQLTATPRDAQGEPLQDRQVTFSSDDPAVASVNSVSGVVLGVTPGVTTVRATSEGRTGTSSITVSPRPATRLGFTTHPANGTAGQALAPIRVAVQDELGGTVTDAITSITLSIADNAGGATLGGTVTVNAVAGVATFTTVSLDKSGAGYTLRASAIALSPGISNPFTISPGAAARLAMVTQPSPTTTSGAPLAVQPVARIVDANGNAVSQAGVSVTVQIVGAGATLAGNLTVPTAANGTATFTNLSLAGTSGNYALRFIAGGLVEVTSNPIALSPGTPTGLLLQTPPSATAQSGVPFVQQPVVQLRDNSNNPVAQAGVPITVAVASGGGTLSGVTTVNTNASGQAAFTNLALTGSAGLHTIAFSSPGLGQVVSPQITLTAGAAGRLGVVQQPSGNATNGAPFPTQPAIQLLDGTGNPVAQAGVVVTASIASGPGVLSGTATAITNGSGVATFTNLAITGLVGTYRLRFDAPGVTGVGSTDILLGAGPASNLVITTQPAGAVNGVPLSQQPGVQLTDGTGNPVGTSGVTITAALASGPGVLGGTLTATTNAAGLAQFTNLSITGSAGSYTIQFTSPAMVSVISATIPLGAGAPSQLSITTQPSSTAASGAVLATQPVIQVRDAANNPVPQAGIAVTAAIATGGGTLGGTVTVNTDASGVATFTNLAISGTVGNRTLQFTSPGLSSVTSGAITITAGAASRLGITTQPSAGASSGAPFSQQPVIQIQDASGNAVAQNAIAITATVESGAGGTLGGTTVVVTSPSGVGTFTNLMLTGASGVYTLRFSAAGLTHVISSSIGLGAGAPSKLAITTQPSSSAQNAKTFAQQPVIQLLDAGNNPVSQAGVSVTVSIASGGGTLGGTATIATNASGVATFSGLSITGTVGSRTLIFASSGLVSVNSNAIAITPGDPDALVIATQPSAAAQSGIAFAQQPVIQLVDVSGNNVSQAAVNVTAGMASGGGTLNGTTIVATNASGIATFTNLSITGLTGVKTLGFAASSLTGTTSNGITLAAGPATQLTMTLQPSTTATNGTALAQQPQIQLRDGGGNPVSAAGVLITAAVGAGSPAGTVSNETATTNGSGLATFTGLTITGLVGSYTLQFTSPSLTSVTSGSITLSAGAAASLSITTQPGANAQSGIAIPTQPAIQLRDQSGNAVSSAGVTVTAEIASDPGGTPSLASATANTNGSGLATFSGLAITGTIGAYTLQFTSGSLTATPASNTITLAAGAVESLSMFDEPSANATSGAVFANQPVVRARDGAGNNVSGVVVTAAIASGPGGATLGGTLTATSIGNGRATFTNLSISGPVGAYTLQFTATGATSATSQTITLAAGDPAKLAITTQPSSTAQNDVEFATQPVIQVQDGAGNPVNDNNRTITAAIASGGGTLGGTLTANTNASGVATFTDLKVTGTIGARTISFSATGLTGVASNSITIVAGVATQLYMVTQPPTTIASGAVLTPNPVVGLKDVSGNVVDSSGVSITVSIGSGGETLGGTDSRSTDGSGHATFNDLTITGTVGSRTLDFDHTGLTGTSSNAINVTAGAATSLTVSQQPSAAATNDVAFAQQPIVHVTDASNNPVAGFNVTVSLTGGGTLSGASLTVATDASGNASFSGLKIEGLAGTKNLHFVAGGLSDDSQDITLSAGAATKLVMRTQPSGTASDGLALAQQPEVELQDSGGNLVTTDGVDITPELVGAGGTLAPLTPVATVNGVATFSGLTITGTGTFQIQFTAPGLTAVTSGNIVVSF